MAETFGFFDAEELTDGTFDREYIAEQWANYFKLFVGNGVFATPTNQLKVVAYNGMFVKISIGWAFINGYWYHNDTELEVEIPANMTASTITDGIFIRWNSADREIKAVVGVDRTTPNRVAPYYELKLADIVVSTGATQITDAEITDTRMDSSVCGIVTGVIEVIDAGNLFAQYEAIFTQWMSSTDTDFDEWRDNQEALYTQWYNAIKAQQTQDLEDFDAWFDAIKGQLSEDAAGHLQNEIDDIIAQGLSGSIFTITTTQTELYGKDVTITGPNVTKTGKFSSQGVAVITGFTDVGTITITSTDNLETATTVMGIPYFGRYTATLAFWSATVNLEGVESLYGSTITVKNSDNLTVGTVTLSVLDGTGVFTATAPDTYTFVTTYEGETLTWELEVSQETTYNLELSVGFELENWLIAGNVDPTDYEDLDEVLEDEKALWKLFTKHSSVDYLADVTSVDGNITKIFNNDLVAKWINLRDYALDTLHANEVLAEVMDEADKYGYGEWTLMPQVPKMTASNAPFGVASASSELGTGNEAWKAFDGDDTQSSVWAANNTVAPNVQKEAWIQYKFVNPVCIKRIHYAVSNVIYTDSMTILGSNDGTNFETIDTLQTIPSGTSELNINNENEYLYYRFSLVQHHTSGSSINIPAVRGLQLYAWAPKGNVPVMTANTAPYGKCAMTGTDASGYEAYHVFDGKTNTSASVTGSAIGGRLYYMFSNPVNVRKAFFAIQTNGGITKSVIWRYSDDGTTWSDALSETINQTAGYFTHYTDIPDCGYHLYWAFYIDSSSSSTSVYANQLQFYGRELSVSVPVMTSNTSPFGEVIASGQLNTSTVPYKAFDNDDSTYWQGSAGGQGDGNGEYIGYKFPSKMVLKVFRMKGFGYGAPSDLFNVKVQGSNDGVTWTDVLSQTQWTNNVYKAVDVDNEIEYLYYKAVAVNSTMTAFGAHTVKFYGLDYSERDFDENLNYKTLYDHGVELETMDVTGYSQQGQSDVDGVKSDDCIKISCSSGSSCGMSGTNAQIDLTDYDLLRVSGRFITIASNMGFGALSSKTFNNNWIANVFINGLQSAYPQVGVDVSSVNQAVYLAFRCYGTNGSGTQTAQEFDLTELWLE